MVVPFFGALAGARLLCLLFVTGCITQTAPSAVSIHAGAGNIYPPRSFYGRWQSNERIIAFRFPPEPAVSTEAFGRRTDYDVATMRRNTSGTFSFTLAARGGGPQVTRTFLPPDGDTLVEVENDGEISWRRVQPQ